MLIKDNLQITKLSHNTKFMSVCIELSFNFNYISTLLKFDYIPDKFKLEQSSINIYVEKLLESQSFDLESLSALITEDLFDIAVPKHIKLVLSQEQNNIKTSITTTKTQPGIKITSI